MFVRDGEIEGLFGHEKMLPTRIWSSESKFLESGDKITPRDGF